MTIQNSISVCVPCRFAAKQTWKCPHCGLEMAYAGRKWRAPKKNNDRAWKMIAAGDWLWDKMAIDSKAVKQKNGNERWKAALKRKQRMTAAIRLSKEK